MAYPSGYATYHNSVSFHQKENKLKYTILLLTLLTASCSSKAQNESNRNNHKKEEIKYEIKDGMLASYDGIELLKYELDVEDFDVEQITLNHLLCLSTDECDKELTIELLERGNALACL